ncbi:MAG: alpha/beta fold hydrolase [Lachnospiraceae bacterium]
MYIQLNGQILYYEKTGTGQPFLLLHGNGESVETFRTLIPQLSQYYTVYAIDTRGHGQSGIVKEYHYQEMADDIVGFIHALHLEKPLLYGFSDGGILGLLIASQHPELLSGMALSGPNRKPSGCKLRYRIFDKLQYLRTKDPLLLLMIKEPNIKKSELQQICIPTLILAGSKDLIRLSETKAIASSITGSTLRILPGEDHFSYVVRSSKLFPILQQFFEF